MQLGYDLYVVHKVESTYSNRKANPTTSITYLLRQGYLAV